MENLTNTNISLDPEEVLVGKPSDNSSPKGWMWCCDKRGRYLECSPEVSEILGLTARDFIGMPVAWFGLTLSSAERLQEALLQADFPTRLELIFQTPEGDEVPVSFYIIGNAVLNGNDVLRGFVQTLDYNDYPGLNNSLANPNSILVLEKDQIAPQTERYQHANQLILSMLEELQQNEVEIRSALASRVIKESDLRVVEDHTRSPRVKGVLYDKKLMSYPETIVLQVIFRLEWGKKLNLSKTEENYLEKNRISAPGLAGKVQHRFAPPKLLVYDKFWIAVELAVVKSSDDSLSIIYEAHGADQSDADGGPSNGMTTTLEDFLANPQPVQAELRNAVDHPVYSRRVLHRGRDYLVRD